MPTLTSFWITAPSEEQAISALYQATDRLELRLHIGNADVPIELINTTCRREEYDVIFEEGEDEDDS